MNINDMRDTLKAMVEKPKPNQSAHELAAPDMSAYVKLPRDRDGVAIRPGDTVRWPDRLGDGMYVTMLKLDTHGAWHIAADGGTYQPNALTHAKPPRTLRDVLADLEDMGGRNSETLERLIAEAYEIGMKEGAR